MRTSGLHAAAVVLLLSLTLPGCPSAPSGPPDARGGLDVGTVGHDSGTTPDANTAADGQADAITPIDVGPRADSGTPVGCNPVEGVHCDGDWTSMCTPACTAAQCCSPQHGQFACVPRNADGTCPLADLFIDGSHITTRYRVTYANFAPNACEIAEGCIDAPGLRRLLRFDTWTPNQGTADMFLGTTPAAGVAGGPFEWSSCHSHHHFSSYADYELLAADGTRAATGHKQAFCLEDFYQYPCGGMGQPTCSATGARYNCGYQGIEMGWQDVYSDGLPCQWIDVTDVAPGTYTLHISLNSRHILAESNYDNNELRLSVTVPPPPADVNVTTACPPMTPAGLNRDCGWNRSTAPGIGTCTAGASVTLACSAACGLGTCTGDSIVRVCDAAHDPTCTARWLIAQNDDSACGSGTCGRGGDCCSQVTFTCPASGTYAAFWGAYTPGAAVTCALAAR